MVGFGLGNEKKNGKVWKKGIHICIINEDSVMIFFALVFFVHIRFVSIEFFPVILKPFLSIYDDNIIDCVLCPLPIL